MKTMVRTLERFMVISQVDDELYLLWDKIASLDAIQTDNFYLEASNDVAWVVTVKSLGW